MNKRFHQWLDRQGEPNRMWFCLSLFLCGIVPVTTAHLFKNLAVQFGLQLLGLLVLFALLISRHRYLSTKHKGQL